jgi:transcriptional regulator with XRE-family HTH domain
MDYREQARGLVRDELARRDMSRRDLARTAGVDVATIVDFLAGSRWPRLGTLGKIDVALGWEVGHLDRVSRGEVPSSPVSGLGEDADGVMLDVDHETLAALTSEERDEAIAVAKASFLERARQIRRSREG